MITQGTTIVIVCAIQSVAHIWRADCGGCIHIQVVRQAVDGIGT